MKIKVRVQPNAKQNKLIEIDGGFKAYLTVPPLEGRANQALIQLLSEHFQIKRSKIKIILGQKIRNKLVELTS